MSSHALPIPDRRLLFFTVTLLGLGLVSVYGASSYEATLRGQAGWSVAINHAIRAGIGLAICFFVSLVPYRTSCRLAFLIGLPISIILLSVTVIGGAFVAESAGIGRWLRIANVSVQPVDLAKLTLVLGLPYWLVKHPESTARLRGGLDRVLLIIGVILILLALQPNFGSVLALSLLSLCILFLGGARLRHLFLLGLSAAGFAWLAHAHVPKLQTRIADWLIVLLERDPSGTSMQSLRALTALGSGGLFGEGIGRSTMQLRFLPESDTDFVFAILGEEMGFAGAALVVILFALWTARALKIAVRSEEPMAQLVAYSVGAMVFVYAALNLMMVTALMPVAGLPLPFVSRGGSALVTNMAACGVLLNVARTAGLRRGLQERWKGASA